jgi:CheY-like chemotaxis protein
MPTLEADCILPWLPTETIKITTAESKVKPTIKSAVSALASLSLPWVLIALTKTEYLLFSSLLFGRGRQALVPVFCLWLLFKFALIRQPIFIFTVTHIGPVCRVLRCGPLVLPIDRVIVAMSIPIILVVEDRQAEQYILQHLLKRFDYDVQVVSSAESALDALKVGDYAAILMDIRLPGMTGIECTRQIRRDELKSGRRIPIIAVTAKADISDRAQCIAGGMDDYLSKPFTPEQLRRILERYVREPSANMS